MEFHPEGSENTPAGSGNTPDGSENAPDGSVKGWMVERFFFLSLFVYFPVCSIKLGEDTPLYAEEDEMKRGRVKRDTGGGV